MFSQCFLFILSFVASIEYTHASETSVDENVQPKCQPGLILPIWQPQDNLTLSDKILRGTVYFLILIYLFLGVSIVSDRFMGAIEVITSQEREVTVKKKGLKDGKKIKVKVWNETVANLTLMALGSSAPEILLSVIEIIGKKFEAGDLGPGTIVGSAAYNLFVIIAICVYVVPDGETRKIKHLGVFFITAFWSIFAYIWLYLILDVISVGVIEPWEGFLTFMFFPATVLTAYIADRRFKIMRFGKFRLKPNRVIVGAENGDNEAENEIEDEISEGNPHHFAIILRDLKKRHSNATPQELEKLATEELSKRTHKSKAFYRLQANKNITGGVAQTMHIRRESSQQQEKTVSPLLKGSKIYFSSDYYSVLENIGEFEVNVVREGPDLSQPVTVFYTTEDGTAIAGSDYEGATGTLVFMPNETLKTIKLRVIDDDIFEEDEHFYLHLTKVVVNSVNENHEPRDLLVTLGEQSTATIVILDDDHCGIFGFMTDKVEITENVGIYKLEVVRNSGARGQVRVDYIMKENTAKHERHFIMKKGTLEFENNETRKEIEISIVEEDCYEKNVSFFVELQNLQMVENGYTDMKKKNRLSYDERDEISCEELVALSGRPKLGNISKIEVVIRESDEFKNAVNKLVEQEGEPKVGFSTWSEQFTNAFKIKVYDNESESSEEATWCDYIIHFLTFIWKLLFAFIPPADLFNGYICFFVSIFFIGVITAVINDVASYFGCSIGLKDSVTAVTFIALGTSVPDTFASKVAAIQDSTADNSVGNVTGSNAVNVFLGIGIAWCLASFYHKFHGREFTVNSGNLAFCVTLFCTEAVFAVAVLILRRSKIIGGELGGPRVMKYITAFFLLFLWIIYITASALEAYGMIKSF